MIGLVIFACVSLLVGFLWWVDRDRRRHGELPKAADYVPPSNCRTINKPSGGKP